MDAKALLQKYSLGQCTAAERDIVESWYLGAEFGDSSPLSESEISDSLARIEGRLESGMEEAKTQTKTRRLWQRVAVAASIVLVASLGLYYFSGRGLSKKGEQSAYANDIAPGKVGATLTLGNGTKINLASAANGSLAKQAGVTIIKTADGRLTYVVGERDNGQRQLNTLSTSRGETYTVTLPDGSKVWLNAASSLSYTTPFSGLATRLVDLTGEAYFQVAKDKAHPFIVKHGSQQVEVLGTHFNVSSYTGEPLVTTLEEGSVKVSSGSASRFIVPGEQAISTGSDIKVQQADLEQALAWKDGNFIYSGVGIKAIMAQLERWYDIEVVYEGKVSSEVFYGNISRFKNISQVLKMLEKTKVVHFSIEGRRITVKE